MRGYDKSNLNHQLLLGLTFEEMTGLITHDRAKPVHPCTLHGGTIAWGALPSGCPYINLTSATPDFLDCPAADTGDLNFTDGDFSMFVWLRETTIVAPGRDILCRGFLTTDGWRFSTLNGALLFGTFQIFDAQESLTDSLMTAGTWYACGMTRAGTSVRLFLNGQNRTLTAATHVNPAAANRDLNIGIYDDKNTRSFNGRLWHPRIWGRRLAEWEMLEIFNMERDWFGV